MRAQQEIQGIESERETYTHSHARSSVKSNHALVFVQLSAVHVLERVEKLLEPAIISIDNIL